jgi:hypothetical protein
MEPVLLPMNEETGRLLQAFRSARERMERAAAQDELTEALCLLPPTQRAFTSSMAELRKRMESLPDPEEEGNACGVNIPGPPEYPALESGWTVSARLQAWLAAGAALALMASFAAGFWLGRTLD